jgi:hypothetical protein
MPAKYRKLVPHPFNPVYRLRDAAAADQLIVVHCGLCRRTVYYLASDLVKLYNPQWPALAPLFECGTCRTGEFLSVRCTSPSPGDYGHLVVRRPMDVVKIQKWRNVKLGD